ncbi:MAG: AMP-binding protein [Bacteroidales bacterium]|nr:AMP-binding protein [Bacteroidales bacterium]
MFQELLNHPADRLAAIDSSGATLTYGHLLDHAKWMREKMGERAFYFLLTENNVGGIAWAIGGLLSHNVPLLLNAHQEGDLIANLLRRYKPEYIVVPVSVAEKWSAFPTISEAEGYVLKRVMPTSPELFPELSHLLPTSGSTGSPKLVRHSYANVEAAALNISTFFGLTKDDRPLMVLPLYYTMGLSMVFSHFKVGATLLITGENMTSPTFWKFLKEQEATSFTGVPFSFKVLDMMRVYRMKLPALKLLTQGGGKMERELNLKFAQWCQDTGREWIATYGQSEGTARMAYLPSKWAVEKAGSIGVAVPNGRLWLIDEEGREITQPNVEGEMCYAGKNVTLGYATSPEDLTLGDCRHGQMATGDLAYRDDDGCYYITGRKGRFIKPFGKRVGLDECEQIVTRIVEGDCACVGDKDENLWVIITAPDLEKKKEIMDALVATLLLPATAVHIKAVAEIPKSTAGKILYHNLLEEIRKEIEE